MLTKAIEFATKALQGITDANKEPYINHALRVADKMDTEFEKTVAVLHDVLEDTQYTRLDLEDAGFSRDVVDAVEQLTRNSTITYFEYIDDISTSEVCTKIKLAEIDDNKDIFRVNKLSFQTFSIDVRCQKVKDILQNV